MLDMVDHKAITYAGQKGLELEQEIELLKKAASGGESLIRIHECAQRIAQLRLRKHDYDQAAAIYLGDKRRQHLALTKLLNPKGDFAQGIKAALYYRGLFAATIGRQMLDKWDAEDAAMKETTNA